MQGSPEAAKKAAAPKKERDIKYSDKSPGQPEMTAIFSELRQVLLAFVQPSLRVVQDKAGQIHLHCNKRAEIAGKKTEGIYFASLLVQKGYVGFYFFPVYTHEALKKQISPALLACLKGKSCFHIKKLDAAMKNNVLEALDKGFDCYKNAGLA